MNKRIIIKMTNSSKISTSEIEGINNKKDIKRIWTLYDEKKVLENAPFNPLTGKKATSALDAFLEHHMGVFLEDYIDDWNIHNEELHVYSRVIGSNKPITLLIELN